MASKVPLNTVDKFSFWTERLWRPMQFFVIITTAAGLVAVFGKDYFDRYMARLEIDSKRLFESQSQISRLERSVATLESNNNALKNEIEALRSDIQKSSTKTQLIDSRIIKCPDGYFLVGISFQDQAGLAHGALWGPSATCAKINVGAK
jgi:hypothetical protein